MFPTSQTKVEQIQTHARVISALVPSSLLKTKFLLEIVLPARPERMESRQSCPIQLQISLSQPNQLDDSPTPASTTLPTCSFQDSHACEAILDQHGCHGNHGQTPVVQLRGELQLTLSRVLAGWIGIPSIESCLFNGDPMGSSFYALGFSRILT